MRLTRLFHFLILGLLLSAGGHLCAQTPTPPEEDIRGPKPLIEIPVPPPSHTGRWIAVGAAATALAAATWFAWHYLRRRRIPDPRVAALASLTELSTAPETIPADTFALRAGQALRTYIAARFRLAAPRLTTEEFLHQLGTEDDSPLNPHADALRAFLKCCDLAKFAAADLNAEQRAMLLEGAREFIRVTSTAAKPPAAAP